MTDIFDKMEKKWPSVVVARSAMKEFTGGGISPKTIANAEIEGKGPEGRFFIGRCVCYPVEEVVKWLRNNSSNKEQSLKNQMKGTQKYRNKMTGEHDD